LQADNLRRYIRRSERADARIRLSWGTLEGTVENIGEGGAFFATDTMEGIVEVGTPVELEVSRSDGDFTATGTVLRFERYLHEGLVYRAFAIRFDGRSEDS
jgi:hypothetical protein